MTEEMVKIITDALKMILDFNLLPVLTYWYTIEYTCPPSQANFSLMEYQVKMPPAWYWLFEHAHYFHQHFFERTILLEKDTHTKINKQCG